MSALGALVAGPCGSALVIASMALATYLCRIAGVAIMSRVRITPRIERGLRALPGSIIMATILPVALDNGLPAILALTATIVAMVVTRSELASLLTGLGALAVIRAFG
jgi:uncharacterized membrane protein